MDTLCDCLIIKAENTHFLYTTGKYHCMAVRLYDWFGFS